jgi:predicted nucleic acid-binding Zn ribbon protein
MSDYDQTASETADKEASELNREVKKEEKKRKRRRVLVFVLWVFIIAGFAFLMLFLSAKIAEFDSIRDMLNFIAAQFAPE